MTMTSMDLIPTIFLSLLTICLIFYTLSAANRHRPPATTPCPESYPIVGNLVGFLLNHRRFHDWVADMLSATPSSTLQVNGFLNLSQGVCTADPGNVDHILRSNFPNYVKGHRFHGVLRELLGDGIFNADGRLWAAQRKIASHEFNTKSLRAFIAITVSDEISTRLIPLLSSIARGTEAVDFQEILRKFGFDNICNLAFGFDPDCLSVTTDENSEFAKAFDEAVSVCSSRFMSPLPFLWKLKRLLNIGSEKRFKKAIKTINSRAMEIIKSKEVNKDQDLLSRFMNSIADDNDIIITDIQDRREFLRDIVISFILAGRDSTSTALTWFFWLVSAHPRVASSIRHELSQLSLSRSSSGSTFGYDELKEMNYLHAAISESLRLFPPIPINSRLAISEDVFPDGTRVGKGWFADYSAYAMGRMERLWGPDCREFRPERWLDGGEEGVFRPRDQFRFPVFHGGPRICLGKEMAYVQMKSVAAAVLSEFDVVAVDGGGSAENMVNPPYVLSIVLKMRGGFFVKVKRRS